ncbi:hypothetical protein [Streptomyces sp. WM6386]|uniref:hypothetical protein n=1 Tax=Streptomyces sp. WM6386 TaxID=1415558 RepID=UPI00061972E0|nr:hypothetical protein [Streptomyces sp. WM6386]KKD07970.1 hypothetical protein TN53_11030 [Streptomyces sp. WM6386]
MGESESESDRTTGSDPGQEQSSRPFLTAITAFGSAVALAFTSVFFGWLPNPWEGDDGAEPGLEALSLSVEEEVRVPAVLAAGESKAPGKTTTLGTPILLTLRNRGDLTAVITDFRFTVEHVYRATDPCGRELPPTGGGVTVTGSFDVTLPDEGSELLVRPFEILPGTSEAVQFVLGEPEKDPYYEKEQGATRVHVVEVSYREGTDEPFRDAGAVAFLSPPEASRILLQFAQKFPKLRKSDLDCSGKVRRDLARAVEESDRHGRDLDDYLTLLKGIK